MLRPLPAVRWLCAAFAVLLVAGPALLVRDGFLPLAGLQLLLGLAILWGAALDLLLIGPDPPLALAMAGEGLLELEFRSGRRRKVRASPSTLVWGSSLLLVLEGDGPPVRLLLGPGNLEASQLAALRREWLRARSGLTGPLA